MPKNFTRTIENFTCGHCGADVTGNGYTNHCPHCLYSRHVDVNPGDRAATCGGLMKPVSIETKDGAYMIVQECVKCHHTRRNKTDAADSIDAIAAVSSALFKLL